MASCFIIKGFGVLAVKIFSSVFFLVTVGETVPYIISLIINIAFVEIASVAGYQLAFFAYCVRCRYEAFVELAKRKLTKFQFGEIGCGKLEENIKLIEDLAHLHFKLAKALDDINAIFSIDVSTRKIC
jgi:hypothetical protein